jgi:hypothetical protein
MESLRRNRPGTGANRIPAAVVTAVDSPPPVASPVGPTPSSPTLWRLRELQYQTPQLLTTLVVDDAGEQEDRDPGNLPPHPADISLAVSSVMIVDETYLVVGTDQGTLVVWDLAKVVKESTGLATDRNVSPLTRSMPTSEADPGDDTMTSSSSSAAASPSSRVVDLKHGETRRGRDIVGRVVGMPQFIDPRSQQPLSLPPPPENLVIVATEWGVIAIVDVGSGDVLCRFDTGRCSVTCVTATPPSGSSTTLLVGYQTGALECWAIREVEALAAATKDAPKTVPSKRFKAHLLARGSTENGFPVRSLAAISMPPDRPAAEKEELSSSQASYIQVEPPEKSEIVEQERQYVMMTFESNRQIPASRVVKVVDLASLVAAFSSLSSNVENDDKIPAESTIRLEDHWILPGAGMELIDPSLPFAARAPFQTQWIPSAGTNQLLTVPGIGVAFSCADGMIGILRASSSLNGNDGLTWGLAQRSDQLLLSYPSIGMGAVSMLSPEEGDSPTTQCLACCLRGGTVYFIPLDSDASAADEEPLMRESRSLKVVAYPNDVDTDVAAVQQVQLFTAGGVRLRASDHVTGTVPILVYVWPGGIIDIYMCHLQTKSWSPPAVLEQLVDNGSARLLQELLLLPGIDLSLRGQLWGEARRELLQRKKADAGSDEIPSFVALTTGDLEGDSLRAVRTLLLQLAVSTSLST